jgi:ABC-type siderophore export system fused ATPase/permease subunit
MGIILDSEDKMIDQVLDIVIIFVLGTVLLFFFNAMINHPRFFIMSFSLYISIIMVLYLVYLNNYCIENEDNKNKVRFLNFISIYTICLNTSIICALSFGII